MVPSCVLKIRGGCGKYVKQDGKPGTSGRGPLVGEEVAFTVAATQDQTLFQPVDFRHGLLGDFDDATNTINAKSSGGYSLNYQPGVTDGYIVRRLTPVECERLQGFPDNHTNLTGCDVDEITEKVAASLGYDEKQKELLRRKVAKWAADCPDGPRYKAVGNSMAVNVMLYIGTRLQMVQDVISEGPDEGHFS
jgi:site-specific DNA-cytosine methylase